jgi:hypothetical protein
MSGLLVYQALGPFAGRKHCCGAVIWKYGQGGTDIKWIISGCAVTRAQSPRPQEWRRLYAPTFFVLTCPGLDRFSGSKLYGWELSYC